MFWLSRFLFLSSLSLLTVYATASEDYMKVEALGGQGTVLFRGQTVQAFEMPANNLSEEEIRRHLRGNQHFERNFSDDPSRADYGLGPAFNNTSCVACHARDGRGAPPLIPRGQDQVRLLQNQSLFLRISIEPEIGTEIKGPHNKWGAPIPVPGYSDQLFHLGSFGLREDVPGVGQAQVYMRYQGSEVHYPDGESIQLRKPLFEIKEAYHPRIYESDVRTSPRLGPALIGMGLIEAIPEQAILNLAMQDHSEQGVSGKPNWVFDLKKQRAGVVKPLSVGRFGHKASTPTVYQQTLGALHGDMGITSEEFPEESIAGTLLFDIWQSSRTLKSPEILPTEVQLLVFYTQTLAVPSRRDIEDPEVQWGGQVFKQVGCTSCHHPSFETGAHELRSLSFQKIYPFSDFLLHDMGEELADHRQDFDASGTEWRTAPLWGLGQIQTVNPKAGFLHDGRARTLEEAILWHGGEGSYSRSQFMNLKKSERQALLKFLKSL